MIEVDSFILRNIVHFNEAKVPVRRNNGLVIISGLNKDSRIADDQNNGAGKSLLWSAIPNVRYAAAPSSTLKNTKKDMLDSSKSEIEIRFTNNQKKKVKVVQKPTKWVIYEENAAGKLEDIKARTTAIQQDKMAEHFPLSQDEFYAYTFLSSIQGQRLHFQVERPADRLKFITSIFQLDAYDRLKKFFTGMLAKIKDEQTKFDVLESKLLNVNSQLAKVAWSEDEAETAKQAKEEFKGLKTKRDKLSRLVSNCEQSLASLRSLAKLTVNRDELAEDLPKDKSVDEITDKLRKRKSIIREYEAYKKQMASYERSVRRIKEALSEFEDLDVPNSKKLDKTIEKLVQKRESISEQLAEARQVYEHNDRCKRIAKDLVKKLNKLGFDSFDQLDLESDIDDELSICRTTLKLKKLLSSNAESICPTCLQEVDIKAVSKNVKKASKRIQQLEDLNAARQLHSQYENIISEFKEGDELPDVEALESKLEETTLKTKDAKEQLRQRQKITDLKSDLDNIEKPDKPSKVPPAGADLEAIEEALGVCRELSKINHSIDNLLSDRPELEDAVGNVQQAVERVEEEKDQHEAKLKKVDTRYQKLMRLTSEFDLRLGEYRILSKQKLEFEQDISGIRPLLEKRDLYKALEKAYSAKGLKVAKANEIARMLETNLNRYSNLIFAEPFEFSVYATEKGVFCDVNRGNGKVSDVRLLSGSESDSFKLLFMLSLLLMVPSDRRTNFVVLDEPDSHMDERTRSLFAERFIPFLREAVPHVFLITPLDHHIYRECERWVVVKENGVSELVRTGAVIGE
jgi:DNA repair exonuclease SbcCD ATPase subunit